VNDDTLKVVDEVAHRTRQHVDEKIDGVEKWISDVERKANTARTGRLDAGDNLLRGIPPEYRRQCEIAERMGHPDPVKSAALSVWWKLMANAALAMRQPGGKSPSDYVHEAEVLERAWGFDPEEKVRNFQAAISKGAQGEVAGGGSNIIATPVEAEIRRLIRDNTVIRPLATRIIMTSLTHMLPTEAANVSAGVVAEAVAIGDAISTTGFSQVALTAKKIAGLATVSNELMQDNIIGLNEYLFTSMAEAIGIVEDQGALNGTNFTGMASVVGRFTANASGLAVAGNNSGVVPCWPDLVQTIFKATHKSSRVNGRWFMHPITYRALLSTVDSTGQPVVAFSNSAQAPVSGVIPFSIAGFPVEMCAVISTVDTVFTTSSSIYFCDPRRVIYGDVIGMQFDLDPYGLFNTYQTRVRVVERTAIQIPVGTAISQLQGCRAV
jgi:HK97 family phage major capsid protein